jgi:hypothetical protein
VQTEDWVSEQKQYKYMATGNYFDSNRTITEHFQIEAA